MVVVGYLGHFDVHLARLVFGLRGLVRRRRVPIVLDHLISASDTGKDRRLDGGPRQLLLRMIDAAALRAADVIVVDTDEHLASLPERHRGRAVVVHVGAPAPWYDAARTAPAHQPRPRPAGTPRWTPRQRRASAARSVFYGLYTPLQGTPMIGEALGRSPGAASR